MDTVEPQVKQKQNQIIDLINQSNDLDTLKEIRIAINRILHSKTQDKIAKVWDEKGYDLESYNKSIGI